MLTRFLCQSAVCWQVLSIFLTTFSALRGPGLSLRGPDGSIASAVVGVSREVHLAYALFLAGLFLIFPQLAIYVVASRSMVVATPVVLVILAFLVVTCVVGMKTRRRFFLRKDELVSSHFAKVDFRPEQKQQRGGPSPNVLARGGGGGLRPPSTATVGALGAQGSGSPSPQGYLSQGQQLDQDILKAGFLQKLPTHGKGGSWQRRYFVLFASTAYLCWYANEKDYAAGKPKGRLVLSSSTQLHPEPLGTSKGGSQAGTGRVALSEGDRQLRLRGSVKEASEWQHALEAKIGQLASLAEDARFAD